MKKVITYGTFDLFHFGHLELLRRAKKLGDFLVVAVSTDEFNIKKEKKCVYPFEHRIKIVEAIQYVDKVIPVAFIQPLAIFFVLIPQELWI